MAKATITRTSLIPTTFFEHDQILKIVSVFRTPQLRTPYRVRRTAEKEKKKVQEECIILYKTTTTDENNNAL